MAMLIDMVRVTAIIVQGLYCKDYRGDLADDVHHQTVFPVPREVGGRGPGLPHRPHQQA